MTNSRLAVAAALFTACASDAPPTPGIDPVEVEMEASSPSILRVTFASSSDEYIAPLRVGPPAWAAEVLEGGNIRVDLDLSSSPTLRSTDTLKIDGVMPGDRFAPRSALALPADCTVHEVALIRDDTGSSWVDPPPAEIDARITTMSTRSALREDRART